jgi:ATP-dependent DNA helicase PIF1
MLFFQVYMVVKNITGNFLKATILTGKFKGKIVLYPRILLIPSESPIKFKRLQFPINLAFAMIIKKSKVKSAFMAYSWKIQVVFPRHLYVACSNVGKPSFLISVKKKIG